MTIAGDGGGCQWTPEDTSQQLSAKIRKRERLQGFPDKEEVRGELGVGVMQQDSAATYSTCTDPDRPRLSS